MYRLRTGQGVAHLSKQINNEYFWCFAVIGNNDLCVTGGCIRYVATVSLWVRGKANITMLPFCTYNINTVAHSYFVQQSIEYFL